MVEELDPVARYGMSVGLAVRQKTVLVEGTTDADLFRFAAKLERETTGVDLLGEELAILPAGSGDLGGATGIIRELMCLRGLSRACLLPSGRPRYRFIGLFDNDKAGRQAVKTLRTLDNSVLEYKDVFRLWPVMPLPSNLDPGHIQRTFERENACFQGMEWEMEDLFTQDFIDVFQTECPGAIARCTSVEGRVHRDLTSDGKARLHRFVKQHALRADLTGVVSVLNAIRFYLAL